MTNHVIPLAAYTELKALTRVLKRANALPVGSQRNKNLNSGIAFVLSHKALQALREAN